ncbi:MAG TPA: CDP-alcohol phosphatidyltransferase family protein [Gaiellaceae bacterium]|nr:CDP-alcohol phosphatidyltransferase family protein [Gaiellaceae bacterium]
MVVRTATVRSVGRAATLRAARDPLAGLATQLLLLVLLEQTVGLGRLGLAVGGACALTLDASLALALRRDPAARLGPAGRVTLARATLAVGVAALTADSFARSAAIATLVALASVALALDYLDGWVARRTGTSSALGARLDGEVDAFLILVLSVAVAPSAGFWVLAIGAARYAFLAAGWPFAWLRAPLPRRDWRKTVAAAQGVSLAFAAAEIAPPAATGAVLALALALLAESFGRDVRWLWRQRPRQVAAVRHRHPAGAVALTLLAAAVVWAALVAPTRPWLFTPHSFMRLPLEGIVVLLLAAVMPNRAGRFLPWVIGPMLGFLVLVKILDLGFFIAFDRPFNPVDDWSFLSFGVETTRDTFGRTVADLTVAGAVLIVVVALVLPTLSMLRLTRIAARRRRHSLQAGAALTAVWLAFWGMGWLASGASIASASAAVLAIDEVHAVQADLRDQARFDAQLRTDRFRDASGSRLLTGLRGKDVLLVFVESYGKLAVEGSPFSPSVDTILDAGTRQLAATGFSARSGWLSSSTFGGGSWWAHATLQSGTWINTQGRYDELVKSNRLTLASAFGRAGWTTVAEDPSNRRNWPEGTSFYHYDQIYDRRNLGYRGPTYGFSSMPDEYTLLAFRRLVLAGPHTRPIFAEIDTTSSHTPWTRIPPFIPWNQVGDGSIFNRLPTNRSGLTDTQQGYSTSIEYALHTLFSFIQHYGNKNLVLIVLGDHQPSRVGVGYQPGHDVPISIIARDPSVLHHIADWGWAEGMQPSTNAPVWPMNAFRNRFLSAFGS